MSWFVAAASPDRKTYDVFLIDNLHISPVLMKRLFLRRDQKVVAHLGSHTLYFLLSHRFSRSVERLHLWALRNYDAVFCEGHMSAEIARVLIGERPTRIYETFLGLPEGQLARLHDVQPDLHGKRIVFIGSGSDDFRMHYKGLDLMTQAVARVCARDPEVTFEIVGEWDRSIAARVIEACPPAARGNIHFRGRVDDVVGVLAGAGLYLHCARGDAFPTATIEAMAAGVVPIVSEWTGTKQLVANISDRLISPLDAGEIASRILWFLGQDADERRELSSLARAAAAPYTAEAAMEHYKNTFDTMCQELGVGHLRSRAA
jgi:glycosyltransferase involved in cell wall biosynthesis